VWYCRQAKNSWRIVIEQFENRLLNTLVEKFNAHSIKIDVEMIKKAITNSPQITAQSEVILMTLSSEDRLEKIKALIVQMTQGRGQNSHAATFSIK
jgi:nitrogen regulatory protein PII-like uncharacterized protein